MNLLTEFPSSGMDKRTVEFLGEKCTVEYLRYRSSENGPPAIQLICPDGEPMATATVNVPQSEALAQIGCVAIKTWSENEGMDVALEKAGIATRTEKTIPCGHTFAVVMKLTPDLL